MQNALWKPSNVEIQQLLQILSLPGYQVLEKVFLTELDLMQVNVLNVDGGDPNYRDVLAARHGEAKGGAKFYAQVCEKIAGYQARVREANQPDILPDSTADLFDDAN